MKSKQPDSPRKDVQSEHGPALGGEVVGPQSFRSVSAFERRTLVSDPVSFADDTDASITHSAPLMTQESGAIATLKVLEGPDILKFRTLDEGVPIVVGREEGVDLQINDRTVSKRHVQITLEGDVVRVEDLGSTNGTRIRGIRLTGPAFLAIGERLDVGQVALRVELLPLSTLRHLWRLLYRLEDATNDPLTGLKTRRILDEELPAYVETAQTAGVALSILFLDIDHFKRINDTFGHAIGDDVLRTVARAVLDKIRESDMAARYGGEELIVVLPGITGDRAVDIANRIRTVVGQLSWEPISTDLRVTVSIGVAQVQSGEGLRAWLQRADKALYAAKQKGRNQVLLAP